MANAAAVYANSAADAANAAADRVDSAVTEIPSLVEEEVQEATETLSQSFVSFDNEQTVTEEQASTARANINAEKAMTQQEVIDILIETGFIDEEEE